MRGDENTLEEQGRTTTLLLKLNEFSNTRKTSNLSNT
jgi:hypothetical protein